MKEQEDTARLSTLRCPMCNTLQPLANICYGRSFRCATCRERLRIPNAYSLHGGLTAIVLSVSFAFVAGWRGWWLVFLAALVFAPVSILLDMIRRRILPPRLEVVTEEDADE